MGTLIRDPRVCSLWTNLISISSKKCYLIISVSRLVWRFNELCSCFYHIKRCKFRSSRPEVLCWKGALENFSKFTGKHLCQGLILIKLLEACNVIKKEVLAQAFSGKFCEIFKNTFSTEQLWTTASDFTFWYDKNRNIIHWMFILDK